MNSLPSASLETSGDAQAPAPAAKNSDAEVVASTASESIAPSPTPTIAPPRFDLNATPDPHLNLHLNNSGDSWAGSLATDDPLPLAEVPGNPETAVLRRKAALYRIPSTADEVAPLAPHPAAARQASADAMPPPAPVPKPQKTLIVTHLECANHVTPALMGTDYVAGAAAPFASPEQPERVKAVWAALKQCAWTCGGLKVVDAVELSTSPTLNRGLDDTLTRFASPETGPHQGPAGAPRRAMPARTASVEFLFDDLEPVVLRVHDFDYLSRVATHVEALQRAEAGVSEITETKRTLLRCVSTTLTGDTFACARSLHAALCASYTVCKAIDAVVRKEYRNAFCVVRPPGHHAGNKGSTRKDKIDDEEPGLVGQGFCLINHVAVGARHALARHESIKKVVVIDWDLHHGNGTEQILSDPDGPLAKEGLRDRVLFCSIHGAGPDDTPLYPGTARAPSTNPALNVPLPRGAGPAEFLRGFQTILDAAEAFGPDLILVSAGFDAHKDDMFRFLHLNDQCYRNMTRRVMDLAARVCEGRVVSLLEGGYTISTLVRCSVVHARALATHGQPGACVGNTPSRPSKRRPAPLRDEDPSRKRARRAPKKMDV